MNQTLLQTTANKSIRKGYLDGPYGQIHFWTAGKGKALLLIHQSSASVEEYASLVPFLADDFQLVAYDWPGNGHSDDPDQELGIEEFTAAATAVLDHLKIDRFHALGHHGGALVAMNLGFKYPDRVDKLILSGTSALKKSEEKQAFLKSLQSKKQDHLDHQGQSILDAWKRYVNYMPGASPDQVLRPFLNNIVSRLRPFDAHAGVLRWDRRAALKSLKGPVLLMQGALDSYVSEQEKLLEILPHAKRIVLENGGAFMFYDRAQECAEIIHGFLADSQ